MKSKNIVTAFTIMLIVLGFASCNTIPKGAEAVKQFDKAQYLGKWYEIARLDFKQEKDLNNTSAEYSLNDDGSIKVVNRGFNTKEQKWVEAEGRAKFVKNENEAMLKVSFFGPFYSGYNIIALDPEYRYALVAGKNLDYLWILSRQTSIPEEVKTNYLETAKKIGYNTDKLIWVSHDMTAQSR